ncbi:MAG: fimbrillin family protein [Bacteroidaceae bacterium]
MRTTNYFMMAAFAVVLSACSNDETENKSSGPVEAQITAGMSASTRAVNVDNTWTASDSIGVMVTGVTGTTSGVASLMENRYKNVKYTTTSGGTSAAFTAAAGAGIFFQDASETVTFAAYYPYAASTNASTLPSPIAVYTKTDNTAASQAKIDFLFASGAIASKEVPYVEFYDATSSVIPGKNCQFKHQMAQLKLVIKASTADGFTDDEAKEICTASTYHLSDLIHAGTFTVTTTGGTAAINIGVDGEDWDITNCVHTDAADQFTRTYTLILLPQDKSTAPLKFRATIGEQTYTNNSSIAPNLEAGKSYTYTITLKKNGLFVSGCTIAPWGTTSPTSGDAIM